MHGVVELVAGDPHRAGGVGEAGVGGVVLEDDEGVEQFAAAREPGGTLDLGEAEVLVVQQTAPARPGAGAAGRPGCRRAPSEPGRQGVDEQADHGLDAVDGGVAAGDGGAEDHVLPAGQPARAAGPRRPARRVPRVTPCSRARAASRGGDPLGQLDADLGCGRRRRRPRSAVSQACRARRARRAPPARPRGRRRAAGERRTVAAQVDGARSSGPVRGRRGARPAP